MPTAKTVVKKLYSENNDFQHIEVLKRNREKRCKYKEFFLEGVKPIERALHYGWEIKAFVYAPERSLSGWAREILQSSRAPIHYELPLALMEKLSDKEESSELIAVVAIPAMDLSRISLHPGMLVLVCDRPASPGNLGTIIRSGDSFRADGVIVTGHAVDLYDSQTIRASVGSLFALPILKVDSQPELSNWFAGLREKLPELQIIGTSARAETGIWAQDLTRPTVLLVGNETEGLSRNYKSMCDTLVKIPIYGSATSLNVACATSIFLYEATRQREAKQPPASLG